MSLPLTSIKESLTSALQDGDKDKAFITRLYQMIGAHINKAAAAVKKPRTAEPCCDGESEYHDSDDDDDEDEEDDSFDVNTEMRCAARVIAAGDRNKVANALG